MTEPPRTEADIAALPIWHGPVALAPLHGGLSNVSFVATDRSGRYVVRLTRDFPFHGVYRDREVGIARAAHAAGFAPEVVHAAPGLMVSRFLEARALTAEDVRADIERIAALLRRFHAEMPTHTPAVDYAFDVFDVIRSYLRQLAGHADPTRLAQWARLNDALAAEHQAAQPVFAHHDLLPGNLLDDGRRLWLIDFEYAGIGSPLFDLANLSSHAGFSTALSDDLLTAYFGRRDAVPHRAHRAMEAASLLREALWSLVSDIHIREREVDYVGYADRNFARLHEVLAAR